MHNLRLPWRAPAPHMTHVRCCPARPPVGTHAALWVPLGVVGFLVICLGIPLLTFLTTFLHRTKLETVHVAQTYGFLYDRYK
jgi:hypothetical protein